MAALAQVPVPDRETIGADLRIALGVYLEATTKGRHARELALQDFLNAVYDADGLFDELDAAPAPDKSATVMEMHERRLLPVLVEDARDNG